jgi:hypothetical protein
MMTCGEARSPPVRVVDGRAGPPGLAAQRLGDTPGQRKGRRSAWREPVPGRPTAADADAAHLTLLWVDGEAPGAVKVVHRLRAPLRHLGCGGAGEVGLPAAFGRVVALLHEGVEVKEDGGQPILGAVLDRTEHLGVGGVGGRIKIVVMS